MKRTLLAALGVTGVSVVVALTLPKPEAPEAAAPATYVTKTDCRRGPAVTCDALDPLAKKGAKYRRVRVPTRDCASYKIWSDGGVEALGFTHRPSGRVASMDIVEGSCTGSVGVVDEDAGVELVDLACACHKAKGACVVTFDGGTQEAPKGKTLGPGYPPFESWSGEGCQPKACVEFAGEPSWPANCPKR